MSNLKKLFIVALVFAFSLVVGGTTFATISDECRSDLSKCTTEELQEYIAELNQQLQQLQQQLTQLQGQGETTEGTTGEVTQTTYEGVPAGFRFEKNLSYGMVDSDVVYLKKVLDVEVPDHESWTGSEYFGTKTKNAVISFCQKYKADISAYAGYEVGCTGFVGSGNRAKLNELLEAAEQQQPQQPPAQACTSDAECDLGYKCVDGSCVKKSADEITTEEECTAVGYYWYDSACHEEEQQIGEGLSVELAEDNPVSATIVADSASGDGAQSLIPFLKVKFTNGDASEVKVTEIKFTRSGISADSNISQAYLSEGETLLAEYNSFSNSVLTFSNSAGLFTIPAGESKTITLKADLANGTASGKTIRFSIESADSIVSDASAVNGTFPLTGNYMSTANTDDLGKLTVENGSNPPSAMDPQEDAEVFNFTLEVQDQKIEVRKLVFTNIGSTDADDLQNFKLYDGATLIAEVANMASDKTVTFDLSSDPLVIDKGVTKNMHLKADIVGGTNRTFRFSIQNMTDILAYDTQYGVYIKPNQTDSWSIVQAGNSTTINTGKLTISRASDSPSGNVANEATNVTIAKFDVKATGEDVKISSMSIVVYGTNLTTSDGMYQGKIYFDGAQKGTTKNLNTAATESGCTAKSFTFGNTFIVPADGETHTLAIKADIKTSTGSKFDGNESFTVKISSVSAQGKDSLASVSVGTASGYQLSIASGALSAAKNQAVGDWSSSNTTGVPGANEVLVGSFVVTAGAAEGADVTAIKITDSGSAFNNLQNLKVYKGTKDSGVQIGSTQSSLTTGSSYTFYPSPYISLAASEQATIYVYADIKTSASTGSAGYIVLDEVDGTGKVTNTSVNYTTNVTGQQLYIAEAGSLTVSAASDQPKSAQVVMGTSGVEFNKLKFETGSGEGVEVTQIKLTATLSGGAPTSTVKNIALYDGDGTQIGSTVSSLASDGTVTFDLSGSPWVISANSTKYLVIKADVNTYEYASSGAAVKLGIASGDVTYKGTVSGNSGSSQPSSDILGNTMYTYKTKVTFALNSSSPFGSSFPSANQYVLYFDVTNNGSYDAYLNSVKFTINYTQGTGNATTAANRVFYLYDSTDLTSYIASSTIAAGTTINGATTTLDVTGVYTNGYPIPAGVTKTFYLKGDTSDCGVTSGSNAGSRIQFYINSGADVNWDDGVSTAVQSSLTKTFPLYGNTLTY